MTFPSGCTAPTVSAPVGRTVAEVFSNSTGSGWRCSGYDVRGQLTQSTLSVSFGTNATISQTVQMAYNDGGEVTQLTYPDGQVLTSVYDNNGRVRSAYFGTPSSTDPVNFLAGQVTYTNAGQIAGMAIGGSGAKASMPTPVFSTATTYDAIQRPLSASATEAGQTIWSQTRSYDSVGNVLGLSTVVPTQGGGTATENEGFCYDALNRLVWAGNSGTPSGGDHCMAPPTGTTLPTYSQVYTYDNLDRMTSDAAGTSTYGDPSHVHAVTGLSSLANPYAAYDAMGNMTCRNSDLTSAHTCGGASPSGALMTYDQQGQLVSWTAPNGTTASDQFLYDAEGNRVLQRATTGSAVTNTVYFDGYTETVRKGGKNTTTTYYNLNGQRVALRVGTGTLDYLLSDPLGSNTAALNSTGQVIALQHYSPYGTVDSSWGTMPTSYGYASQRADGQTGLLYDNFRYYDSLSGRFVRSDNVQDNSKGMDPYAYVGDNPETRNDPSGHCWPWCTMVIGALVGAVVNVGITLVSDAVQHKAPSWGEVAQSAAVGAVTGAITGLIGPEAAVGEAGTEVAADVGTNVAENTAENVAEKVATDASSEASSVADQISLLRGTNRYSELNVFKESGYIMSDAAWSAYMTSRALGASVEEALADAQSASEAAQTQQLDAWGSMNDYIQAHSVFGDEITQIAPRSLISWTTDPNIASDFAGGGSIFQTTVPISSAIQQTLEGAGESEYWIEHMVKAIELN